MKVIPFIIIILISVGCVHQETEFQQILQFESITAPCDSLLDFLKHPEPKVRTRAIEAIGKLQDNHCLEQVTKMLQDTNHNVRLEAAFALGQIGDSTAEASLIERLNSKEITEVKVRILEALGKIGTAQTFAILSNQFTAQSEALRAEAALASARMALRGRTNQIVTNSLQALLNDGNDDVRWKTTYALMRIKKDLDANKLVGRLQDRNPQVRMYAVSALGEMAYIPVLERLGFILRTDLDWRVRVNAARALENYPLTLVADYLSLLYQSAHVRLTIVSAIGASAQVGTKGYRQNSRELNLAKHQLEQLLTNDPDEEAIPLTHAEIGAALISYAKLMGHQAIDLVLTYAEHASKTVRASAMQALGEIHSPVVMNIFEKKYPTDSTVVKIAILEALDKLSAFSNPKLFLDALASDDQVLVALAAKGLGSDSVNNKIYAPRIVEAYQSLPKPVDVEAAQMIFEALGKFKEESAVPTLKDALRTPDKALSKAAAQALGEITGESYTDQIVHFTELPFEFKYRDVLDLRGAKAIIQTERGKIEIKLYAEDAPLTVLNFVRLAEAGFYDGLTFHRVVPNFVIQGGDPRGDSWGSPGYSIPSEFNKHHYLRGTVGMASAGKDTEGCQFFITHSPQPHLDGRYTIFGQVTSGMDVVDKIQQDDVMQKVEIAR